MSIAVKLDLTFRIIVLILAMTVGVLFLFAGARNALAANLKTTAVITGDAFTVGDIFSGLSKDVADKVLGPAPLPGHDIVLNARTLMRVAIALDLPWQPRSSSDQVVIRRAATLISTDNIKAQIEERLRTQGTDGRFDLSFFNTTGPEMVIPQDQPETIEITAFDFDPHSDRFTATLAAPSKSNPIAELSVSGKVERLIAIPVLKKTTAHGDIINASNLEWIDIKSSDLQHDMILKEENIAGMTPRRMIVPGKPVRSNELERPQLVGRGDNITIQYQNGFMTLTAQGKALQQGAKGDLIRVVNTSSNRTIQAFVEGESLVTVIQ